jgi:predicted regulator of Ras-like GTPase activity (Roadblock/LC7/MglB family)
MAISRADRNQGIERILSDLSALRGVTTAALVDADGLVTHIRRDFEMDSDALGAAAQIMFTSARRAASQVNQEDTRLVLSENAQGLVILAPLNKDFVLVLVADSTGMLGTIRFEIRETVVELNNLLGR